MLRSVLGLLLTFCLTLHGCSHACCDCFPEVHYHFITLPAREEAVSINSREGKSSRRQNRRKERKAVQRETNRTEVTLISGLKFIDMHTARASLTSQRRSARRVGRDASAFVPSRKTNDERQHHGFMIIAREETTYVEKMSGKEDSLMNPTPLVPRIQGMMVSAVVGLCQEHDRRWTTCNATQERTGSRRRRSRIELFWV